MNKPTCSIIVPCYNSSKYLPACLDSLLRQTYVDFEVVIIDDGSTDDTDNVIKPYLNDSRMKYIKQQNAGPAKARNKGIKSAEGNFIAFLDSDDLWKATKLEKQMQLFADSSVGVIYSTARYINDLGQDVCSLNRMEYLKPREGKVTDFLFVDNFVPFSSVVIRRECLDKAGLFDEELGSSEDWDLLLRISVFFEFRYIDEPLLYYRLHSNQVSRDTEKRFLYNEKIREKFIKCNNGFISRSIIRQAAVYTYIQAACFYQSVDIRRAIKYSIHALRIAPLDMGVITGFIKTCLMACYSLGRR